MILMSNCAMPALPHGAQVQCGIMDYQLARIE